LTTTNKDFKVKNGIVVSEGGTFGGPVVVGEPTDASHAVTKEYLEEVLASFVPSLTIDSGDIDGTLLLDAGSPTTTVWETTLDGGNL
jgi:hypothetical protein